GFNPQIPLKCAGTRIDPPPSLPTPPADMPQVIAAASPPLDPPGVRSRSHGLLLRPYRSLSVSHAMSSSGVLVTPRIMAPVLRNRSTRGASCAATVPARRRVPDSTFIPATSTELFTLMGTP